MTQTKENFTIVRTFNAPKQLVFEAFSNAEALAKWWGPVEMPIEVVKLDFKPNGLFHYKMVGHGQTNYGIFHYHKIEPYDLIEWVNSFSNEKGDIIKPPFDIDFPLEIYNHILFEEKNGITTLTLSGHPVNATTEQEAVYYAMTENMRQGFGGTLNQLENYLLTLQK